MPPKPSAPIRDISTAVLNIHLAIHRLNIAIAQAKEAGLLGKDILGTGFDFDLEIYQGAGAFVCGEETALMTSIEGKRGMPRPRPPFPAVAGLWQKPVILNNVETLANIGQIMLRGAEWYAIRRHGKKQRNKSFCPHRRCQQRRSWWKFPWEPNWAPSFMISAAAFPRAKNLKPPSWADLPAA